MLTAAQCVEGIIGVSAGFDADGKFEAIDFVTYGNQFVHPSYSKRRKSHDIG